MKVHILVLICLCLPVRERSHDEPVGVTEIFKSVVQCGVDHLQLDCLVHPVISGPGNINKITDRAPLQPHLTEPGEIQWLGHIVLQEFLQNIPGVDVHCQQRSESVPGGEI